MMVDDELEPGPDPTKIRNPQSRRPAEPPRVGQVLRSYDESHAFSIRRPTEDEALAVKSEIAAAVYYLNRWEGYDVRVRPYVTEHYKLDGTEWTFNAGTKRAPRGWYHGQYYATTDEFQARLAQAERDRVPVEHYWKCNFWVHDPLERGFRRMSREQLDEAHQESAAARGVRLGRRRRVVEHRAD